MTLEAFLQKEPPNSVEAEMAILGAAILDPRVVDQVYPILPADAFYHERHAIVWAAILETRDTGGDLLQLHERLRDKRQIDDVGGTAYLQQLAHETPGPASASFYAKQIAGKARLRRVMAAGMAAISDAAESDDADKTCDRAMSLITDATKDTGLSRDTSLGEAARMVFAQLKSGKPQVWQTGIQCFDETFGGLPHGQVVCMLGTSNSGKTTLSLQMVFNIAAIDRVPIRVFSYEQPPDRIAATVLSQQAQMQMHRRMTRGILPSADEWTRLEGAEREMDAADFDVCKESLNAEQIYHKCRLYKNAGVKIVVVDYLQLLPWIPSVDQSETVQTNQACSWLQRIARDLGMTVIIVSQPTVESSRGASDHKQPRPLRMSDAKGGQSISMVTDIGFSIFRPHIDLPKPHADQTWEVDEWRSKVNQVQVICVKGKYEARGAVNLRFQPEHMTFEDPEASQQLGWR